MKIAVAMMSTGINVEKKADSDEPVSVFSPTLLLSCVTINQICLVKQYGLRMHTSWEPWA